MRPELRRVLIVSDAWHPQLNGVVRTLAALASELHALGHEVEVIGPDRFRTLACPTYPEIRLALLPANSGTFSSRAIVTAGRLRLPPSHSLARGARIALGIMQTA